MPHRSTRRRRKINLRSPYFLIGGVILLAVFGVYFSGDTLESHDSFCASCHTQPESDYYHRTQTSDVVDLASFHYGKNIRCIDCHSGRGIAGRLGAMRVGAGDLFAYITHTDTQPAPLTVPIGDENCIKCHQNVPNTQDFNQHFHAFLSRWQALDPQAATCVDCHSSHTTDSNPQQGFLSQARVTQVCQNCHSFTGR